MKRKIELKEDAESFSRFQKLARELVRVPKEEIDKQEKKYKKQQEKKRRA